jgi:hypothetical protein
MGKKSKKHSKKKSLKGERGDDGDGDDPIEERFRAAETRPQFRPLKQQTSKVVLDDRFASVLTDPRFQLEGKDKYGRKKESTVKDELSAFYTVEDGDKKPSKAHNDKDDDSKSESDDDDSSEGPSGKNQGANKKFEEDSDVGSDHEDAEDPASRIAYLTAFSRGELDVSSSSDEGDASESSDEEDGDEDGENQVYGTAGILDPSSRKEEVDITYDSSPYLVVTNLDWEHMRAVDIYCFISSFTPPGALKSVKVYQSDFGKEQMEKEKIHGPTGLWKKQKSNKEDGDDENVNEFDESHSGSSDGDASDSEDQSSEDEDAQEKRILAKIQQENLPVDSDFDPEKLRAYEASKLKYFFAIVEFTNSEHADIAYREVDGLEFEHSSAAIDLRALPEEAFNSVVEGRFLRDQCSSIPSNYEPPDFVVGALQQTNVQCTWDAGDPDRERVLSKFSQAGWEKFAEPDDLKAYIASDASSDEEDSDDGEGGKGSKMRKMLGLDSDSDENDDEEEQAEGSDSESREEASESEEEGMSKEVRYIPGQKDLEEKIRSKLSAKGDPKELTPWEKYQEKRKQKRKERRQAARGRSDDGSVQPFEEESESEDDFFEPDADSAKRKSGNKKSKSKKASAAITDDLPKKNSAKEELELLMAGEDEEERARDFDIRGIQRMEKNKGKKLKGSRKRKEEKLAESISGTDFKVNVEDDRFAAVLDGSDDRFGIDKTDPNFKDTQAMRDILAQQSKRRKKKRKKDKDAAPSDHVVVKDVSADVASEKSSGSAALSSLVKRLKSKVSPTTN